MRRRESEFFLDPRDQEDTHYRSPAGADARPPVKTYQSYSQVPLVENPKYALASTTHV
jgi:hypothetical protein